MRLDPARTAIAALSLRRHIALRPRRRVRADRARRAHREPCHRLATLYASRVFRLGRLQATKGPVWFWLISFVERVVKVDQCTITYALNAQETVTRDGVAVRVNAVLWFRAFDAASVVTTVADWRSAVIQAAETAMRDAIGQSDLDQILKDRIAINKRLQEILTRTCKVWGVELDAVEIKDLDIPQQMQRAIAREAEAIREKRARIIKAEGEQDAARTLADAAATIASAPGALELRRLQTLAEIGTEHNSTVIAMFPTELLEAAKQLGATPAETTLAPPAHRD